MVASVASSGPADEQQQNQDRLLPAHVPGENRICSNEGGSDRAIRVNIKYNSTAGRSIALSAATEIHYDFGRINSVVSVTMPRKELRKIESHPGISYADEDGEVYHIKTGYMYM